MPATPPYPLREVHSLNVLMPLLVNLEPQGITLEEFFAPRALRADIARLDVGWLLLVVENAHRSVWARVAAKDNDGYLEVVPVQADGLRLVGPVPAGLLEESQKSSRKRSTKTPAFSDELEQAGVN